MLTYAERPAAGVPAGLLVLHHGRGADERDLLALSDALDPAHRMHVVTPRAPLKLPGSPGYHWYRVPRVGFPDTASFHGAYAQLVELHDELWRLTGIPPERTVLGGFSMGAVMSYSLGLGAGRPRPRGVLAFSGFLPTVAGWQPELITRAGMAVFIAHGRRDPVIDVAFAREAERRLRDGALEISYNESDNGHWIEPEHVPLATGWLDGLTAEPEP
jgi:phospholipase/carboxylesterase